MASSTHVRPVVWRCRRWAHTIVDFVAAALFVTGSVLFLLDAMRPGMLCFLAGSLCFAAKPTILLTSEMFLVTSRHRDLLAGMAPEGPGTFNVIEQYDRTP